MFPKCIRKDNIITWQPSKEMTLNKYIMLYILPVICTFGFSGSNSFNNNISTYDEKNALYKEIFIYQ